jgi:hypothetical protein
MPSPAHVTGAVLLARSNMNDEMDGAQRDRRCDQTGT